MTLQLNFLIYDKFDFLFFYQWAPPARSGSSVSWPRRAPGSSSPRPGVQAIGVGRGIQPDQTRNYCKTLVFCLGLANGSGSDSGSDPGISSVTFKMTAKNNFFSLNFLLNTFEATFTSFFKDKKSQRSHETVGIKVFLTNFAWLCKYPDP